MLFKCILQVLERFYTLEGSSHYLPENKVLLQWNENREAAEVDLAAWRSH